MEVIMARGGDGYGSEYHLRTYITEHPAILSEAIVEAIGSPADAINWLPLPAGTAGKRELRGMEFLSVSPRAAWREFWATTGSPPNWDAVGQLGNEWILVEAKARARELVSPPCRATE